ncbi:hypothetical protein JHK87_010022 [Glycine soja]|nr:hypothetical protein JHK87_010022 [Glycine soja]
MEAKEVIQGSQSLVNLSLHHSLLVIVRKNLLEPSFCTNSNLREWSSVEKELIRLKREAKLKGGFYVDPEAKLLFIIGIHGYINEEASDKVLEVEQKYNEIRKPVYNKRNDVVKSIPDFWFTAVAELIKDDLWPNPLTYFNNVLNINWFQKQPNGNDEEQRTYPPTTNNFQVQEMSRESCPL